MSSPNTNGTNKVPIYAIAVLILLAVAFSLFKFGTSKPADNSVKAINPDLPAPLYPEGAFDIDSYYRQKLESDPDLGKYNSNEYAKLLENDRESLRSSCSDLLNNPIQSQEFYDNKAEGQFIRLAYLYNALPSMDQDSTKRKAFENTIDAAWKRVGWSRQAKTPPPAMSSFEFGTGYHPAYTQWYLLYCTVLDDSMELQYWRDGGLADELLNSILASSAKWTEPEAGLTGHDYIDASVVAIACYVLINLDLASDKAQGRVEKKLQEDARFSTIGQNLCKYFESSHPKLSPDVLGASYRRGSPETASLVGAKVLYYVLKSILHKHDGNKEEYQRMCTEGFSMVCKLCEVDTSNSSPKGRPYYTKVMVDTYTACYVIRAASTCTRLCMNERENESIMKLSPLANKHAGEMIKYASSTEIGSRYTAYYGPLIRLSGLHELGEASREAKKYWEQ